MRLKPKNYFSYLFWHNSKYFSLENCRSNLSDILKINIGRLFTTFIKHCILQLTQTKKKVMTSLNKGRRRKKFICFQSFFSFYFRHKTALKPIRVRQYLTTFAAFRMQATTLITIGRGRKVNDLFWSRRKAKVG